jgi:hypothetical protein
VTWRVLASRRNCSICLFRFDGDGSQLHRSGLSRDYPSFHNTLVHRLRAITFHGCCFAPGEGAKLPVRSLVHKVIAMLIQRADLPAALKPRCCPAGAEWHRGTTSSKHTVRPHAVCQLKCLKRDPPRVRRVVSGTAPGSSVAARSHGADGSGAFYRVGGAAPVL